MIDFIEYVVAELKTKRLSKANAVSLFRQFAHRAAHAGTVPVIHPFLHRNTSDLSEQRYSSLFTGNEFFLTDHQVKPDGQVALKVLPGVVYLEMARAAAEEALPARPASALLELQNIVWAQPVVVGEERQVNIALLESNDEQADFEIYSHEGDQELIHCQGRAISSREPTPAPVDLAQLEALMVQGRLAPDVVYATCAEMGLVYGPSFQGITSIERGTDQLLARLRLPDTVADGFEDYVLHPTVMDGALQAGVGLIDWSTESTQARLPFALETLRIFAPCAPEMIAWLRRSPGSQAADRVVKLDIDLLDAGGNVCVQMRGLSWRAMSGPLGVTATQDRTTGSLFATPVWRPGGVSAAGSVDFAEHHVVLCELSELRIAHEPCVFLQAEQHENIAQRYSEYALACFQRIRSILQDRKPKRVLFQIVVPDRQEQVPLTGLSALLKTATLENPSFIGQVILVPADVTGEALGRYLEEEKSGGPDSFVKYERGSRLVLRWEEVAAETEAARTAFKDGGVYLITGGTGGLGLLFAKEILERTGNARVVLTGRAELSAGKRRLVDGLPARAGQVSYRQVDLGNLDQVRRLIVAVEDEWGRLDGILHCAGMTADNFILRKDDAEFTEVLAPKVTGTFNLDEASHDAELDFFVLFSAIGGALGNPGQADYATANAFMDRFAAYRNGLVAAKQRHGRTRSIDWPLWQAGGMGVDAGSRERLEETTGMQPMQTATGLGAFYRSLESPYDQLLVAEGELAKLRRTVLADPAKPVEPQTLTIETQTEPIEPLAGIDSESLAERTQRYLRRELAKVLKVPPQKIDPRAPLENYGIDSIVAMKLTNQLETAFGSLSKTLFFEYQTVRELAEYFIAHHRPRLTALLAPAPNAQGEAASPAVQAPAAASTKVASSRRLDRRRRAVPGPKAEDEPIAIVGLSGRYPEAIDLDAYWENLREGKDCITEVPRERWNWRDYFSEDRSKSGHHYSKWGGFIAGVDEFDPLFFNISPVEAEQIDPQERLFLQHAWMAMEDSGYTRASVQVPSEQDLPGQVGVYVGVMYNEYQLFGAEALARGQRRGVPGSAASIANRVSYVLNLHGPSMTLDTMCSSSLTAIHLACEDLKRGRTSLAIAGGVNVSIHANKYFVLSDGQFISSDGHCQSFGEGGDGYIPGEGVGVVVLKRLAEAVRDGDHIYGIIRGSALTHGGKTNGYSVPNPQAQSSAISRALAESHIDARHISYIEAHGTGTKLGDPIEIAALSKSFQKFTQDTGFCLIGSAKSNVGHCESAAGIAGLTKVLLQMQHQQIVPSLHSAQLNPHIDFDRTPFIVNQVLRPWEQPLIDGRTLPRIAGVSSFGAGGSNAHLIVEEYQPPVQQPAAVATVIIVLSAKTPAQLRQKARDLLDFVRPRLNGIDLVSMAYTLQVGREAMEERLGFVVHSAEELVEKLQAHLAGEEGIEGVSQGRVRPNDEALFLFNTDVHLQKAIGQWIVNRKLSKLLDLWVNGLEVVWSELYGESRRPPRMSLPTYPFAKERHWIDTAAIGQVPAGGAATAILHPLLHSNTSDLSVQRYRSTFTGEEFFLADHQVTMGAGAAGRVLPGVACLEMARAAIEEALPERSESTVLEMQNVVWAQPVVIDGKKDVDIALVANDADEIDFEIYSEEAGGEVVHCQGRAVLRHRASFADIDLPQLESKMELGRLEPDDVYAALAGMGIAYGAAFRGIEAIRRGTGQILADLRLPRILDDTSAEYVLHPSMMDGALQTAIGLVDGPSERSHGPRVPFALETLLIVSSCAPEMVAWVRYAEGSQPTDPVVKVDIDLCDVRGRVCVQMRGLSSRELSEPIAHDAMAGSLLAIPVWQAQGVDASVARSVDDTECHLVLCELPAVDVEQLESVAPHSRCLVLEAGPVETIADRYSDYALACFERIQSILQGQPRDNVLVQIVVPDHREQALFAGLAGLLKTASLENPRFLGQLILIPPDITTEELGRHLEDEKGRFPDRMVRYERGGRQVLRWQEVPAATANPSIALEEDGVYLITGGLGSLGLLFAKEIVEQAREARIVLTGRSALDAARQALLDGLPAGRVSYRQLNLGDPDEVRQLIAGIGSEYGRLNGILHTAGMIADRFLLQKERVEFSNVLAPKVTGTFNLDRATEHLELDFFVLFSSIAGAMGNPGQADYATANGFMDQFAAYRNALVAAKQRSGRTRAINWPLWQAGGMGMDPARRDLLARTTGMQPMQTATGMGAFYRSLSLTCDQMLVVEGDPAKMRRALHDPPVAPEEAQARQPAAPIQTATASLVEKTQDFLRKEFSGPLKLPAHRIDPEAALEKYGIDSILAMRLTNQLESTFGSLSKTLFFEYQTIAALAGYFIKAHPAVLGEVIGMARGEPKPGDADRVTAEKPRTTRTRQSSSRFLRSRANPQHEIAIVGLAGRYPQAENLIEFWRNLREGRDSITEIPPERWDHEQYFDPDPNRIGKSYSKWGGFIADVDKFDPLFFNMSPKEATLIDPQERLFLETAWQTIEDAGYSKESISGRRVGVFVGVMWGHYELFGAESILKGNATVPSASHGSIANRVSYFFDFHGPSIALDTMCSSSLTAIHLACDGLRRGEIDAAIAGGVNLSIHPYKYLSLSQGRFAASDGRCRSFGAGGDGYVPGEGVGAVLLKPLEQAVRDGDQIYAVIKSSTINHGGKTNGYSVPNPNAQGDLIVEALRRGNIDPRTLGYIETHGTGTSLGDPIEIAGLSRAFEGVTTERQYLPVGSVKSNIGHLESAAGIAAVTKALLQIKHDQLVPSLHSDPLNPNINFEDSPFYVQKELSEWKRTGTQPRRVGVSSFGAGGSNAHLILEEYVDAPASQTVSQGTELEAFVLSAKNPDALRRYAERVVNFLESDSGVSLSSIAYTSQVGRTPMDVRLVILASTVDALRARLHRWIALRGDVAPGEDAELEGVFYGNLRAAQDSAGDLIAGQEGKVFVEALLANGGLKKIARLWAMGVDVDWSLLHRQARPQRVSLPTYPFARERYWVKQEAPFLGVVQDRPADVVRVAVPADAEEKRRTYHYPQWVPKALAARDGARPAAGPMLILDGSDDLFVCMTGSSPDPIVLVKPGKTFEEVGPSTYTVDPEREEHFHELVKTLSDRSLLPAVILHHASGTCDLTAGQEVAQHLNQGLFTLFHLCRALKRETHPARRRVLSVFSSRSQSTAPLGAAIGGFSRTLALEDPAYLTKTVEIQEGEAEWTPAAKAGLVWEELAAEEWTNREIRYRRDMRGDARRTVRSVRELVSHAGPEQPPSELPLRRNGVYLITGGLGGLGIIFSEYLARNYQAKLVVLGRSTPTALQEAKLDQWKGYGAEVLALQADVATPDDMDMVVREAKAHFATIHGVIHAAGVHRDAFILEKTRTEMDAVLSAKVYGTINVDRATSAENLDFFAMFSSVAGVFGNPGQSDYAFGSHFLDSFAETREALRAAGQRSGRTLSIDWPLWEEGGMGLHADQIALLEHQTGLCPLPTREGIQYWEDFLRSGASQAVALYGFPSRIASFLSPQPQKPHRDVPVRADDVDSSALFATTEAYLKAVIGKEIELSPERIGSTDPLESFGMDSVMINRINARMELDLGALSKTLLYEHETIRELATYLVREAREALVAMFGLAAPAGAPPPSPIDLAGDATRHEVESVREGDDLGDIAIIGMHGSYPHSANLDAYWDNLKQGKDLIELVPRNRWDYEELYHPDPAAASEGKIYCKWGGFLEDHDKFDPQFFKIATEEAKLIDPQERLFLESVWVAIEDAGYTKDRLRKRFPRAGSADVGVFVGVTTNSYHLWAPEERARGHHVSPAAMPWSIANRVSYFFDFNGPSLPVDTACSSSLVAIHLACASLQRRECQVAIAGGVNLYLHPAKYHSLCVKRMVSLHGKCRSYGSGDEGFVPGEGVGALVLKPLRKAIEDHDRIHAVIRASAYDHAGRSNGYSAPNPNAQANLISQILRKAHIHPETIGYVEGHGTGTQLGDSVEIAALTKAFETDTKKRQFCPIGSVKANIGHSESAAGIAGLMKVILQMKHGQLAPSIHSDEPNPNIDFRESPFYLQHGLSDWPASPIHPRRSLVNSFGAGGVNACVIVEEYAQPQSLDAGQEAGPCLFTLSARTEDRLREYADRLLAHLRGEPAIDLESLCHTFQVGREAMEERLAIVVSDVAELAARLGEWRRRGSETGVHRGSLGPRRGSKRFLKLAHTGSGAQSLNELASRWVAGEEVEWETLHSQRAPRLAHAPTYPFARERYWISDSPVSEQPTVFTANLHPLVAYNSSTLKEVRFSSSLPDTAFYAVDHQVLGERIFPGAGYLEMACIAANMAGEQRVRKITDVVWMQPLSFRTGTQVLRTVLRQAGDCVEYVISSLGDENEIVVHSEGRLAFAGASAAPAVAEDRISPQTLKEQCAGPEEGDAFYEKFSALGLQYGPSCRTIRELHLSRTFALAKLKLADELQETFGQFILHPSIIDGALQTIAGLMETGAPQTLHLPFALDEIEILKPVPQTCYAYAERADAHGQNHAGVTKFDIRLLNEGGELLVRFRNLYVRPITGPITSHHAPSAPGPSAKERLLSTKESL